MANAMTPAKQDDKPTSAIGLKPPAGEEASNDVEHVSADGQTFPFRQRCLEACSEVFENKSATGNSHEKTNNGLDLVRRPDDGTLLSTFLLFANPRVADPEISNASQLEGCVDVLPSTRA